MKVRIFVEGGGDSKALRSQCREAFHRVLEKAGLKGRLPRIVASGSRNDVFSDFQTAHANDRGQDYAMLLVDSEDLVKLSPWEHLADRDGWGRPRDAEDEQAQLMVTCMETWIVADHKALRRLFGTGKQGLVEGALPPTTNLENRSKDDVQDRLERATRNCGRDRKYEKGRRSFQALAEIDPAVLEPLLPHFKRFVDTLRARC